MNNTTNPKIIHYCWFVGKPLPELAKKMYCVLEKIPYTAQAYDAKKYAFVSDIDKDFDLGEVLNV